MLAKGRYPWRIQGAQATALNGLMAQRKVDALSTFLIGRGGNHFRPGRRVIYRKETPMSNFHLTLMDRMGVQLENFGDASGMLEPASLT